MLAKLFSHNSTGRGSPQVLPIFVVFIIVLKNINKNNQNVRPLRLEDLERNYSPARNEDLLQKQTQGDDVSSISIFIQFSLLDCQRESSSGSPATGAASPKIT